MQNAERCLPDANDLHVFLRGTFRMPRTITRALSAVAVAGVTTLAVATPVLAAPPGPGCAPQQGKPAYPPGQCKKGAVSDSTATPGQPLTASSGEGQFDNDSAVSVELHSKTVALGTVTTNSAGEAVVTFKVPASLGAGQHEVAFTGPFFGVNRTVSVPFTVVGSATAGSGLPFTGFGVTAASLLGVALIGAGTASVLVGRRKVASPA